MKSSASATWTGGLKSGKGTMTSASGVLTNASHTFATRFEGKQGTQGTNPEELVAAAHASCYSMALSADLEHAGATAERVETTATVTLETVDGKPTVTKSHLVTRAKVPGIDRAKFMEIAKATSVGCPISRLLKAEITLDATLE